MDVYRQSADLNRRTSLKRVNGGGIAATPPSCSINVLPNLPSAKHFYHRSIKKFPRSSRGIPYTIHHLSPPLQTIMEERESLFQTSNHSTNKKLMSPEEIYMTKKEHVHRLAFTSVPAISEFCYALCKSEAIDYAKQRNSLSIPHFDRHYNYRPSLLSKPKYEVQLSMRSIGSFGPQPTSLVDTQQLGGVSPIYNINYAKLAKQNQIYSEGCCMCLALKGGDTNGWHVTPQDYTALRSMQTIIPTVAAVSY